MATLVWVTVGSRTDLHAQRPTNEAVYLSGCNGEGIDMGDGYAGCSSGEL